MSEIKSLKPEILWKNFDTLTQIPRPSKKEQKAAEFCKKFGEKLGLESFQDEIGNVIIRKPATPGMEDRKGIILQGHIDMVPQKNSDKEFNFETDPIETMIVDGWVTADGTTLGADNGMGVAASMAVLESNDIEHGPIEVLITIDEETGMTGAENLQPGILQGDILLNLDSEDEGELYVGCAGGVDVNAILDYPQEAAPANYTAYKLLVKGLKGGHSGMDIILGRANSNKLLFRFLNHVMWNYPMKLAEVQGGSLRNAIPRESEAVLLIANDKCAEFEAEVVKFKEIFANEFSAVEPELDMIAKKVDSPAKVMEDQIREKIVQVVFACPHGVERMSDAMPGLVETSNNLAVVKCLDGKFEVNCLLRSSVDTAKEGAMYKIGSIFNLIGATVTFDGAYPGWKPNPDSAILKTMQATYQNKYGIFPDTKGIHAGLECGILGSIYPNWDMISFGPTIRFPHSPDEKVNIASVEKFWDFLVEVLKNAPKK